MSIHSISAESMILILEYLRAIDLASCREVDKTVFEKGKIVRAIQFHFQYTFPLSGGGSKTNSLLEYRCDVLYVREVKSLLATLSSAQPTKGFWISATWVANAKKYFEALVLPDCGNVGKSRKQARVRQRRGSDNLPPWPSINADLICVHGNLGTSKSVKSKKRLLDSANWVFLRKFYPDGPEFKSSKSIECSECTRSEEQLKSAAAEKKEIEKATRKIDLMPEQLESLLTRKSGIPSALSKTRRDNLLLAADDFEVDLPQSCYYYGRQPLMPGLYNVIPKSWLKEWRHFLKDPTVSSLGPMDSTDLLCQTHGNIVIPPHVEEYLVGLRKGLLNGLGEYPGEVYEIVTAEELEALQCTIDHSADFSVRFCLDGENITWNMEVCNLCDPFNYAPYFKDKSDKKLRLGGFVANGWK